MITGSAHEMEIYARLTRVDLGTASSGCAPDSLAFSWNSIATERGVVSFGANSSERNVAGVGLCPTRRRLAIQATCTLGECPTPAVTDWIGF